MEKNLEWMNFFHHIAKHMHVQIYKLVITIEEILDLQDHQT